MRTRKRDRQGGADKTARHLSSRQLSYRHLAHPFTPQALFTDDKIAAIHEAALEACEELGLSFALPEAQSYFAAAGAKIDGDMVYIGREIIAEALASCPPNISLRAPSDGFHQTLGAGHMLFAPAGGCPNSYDRERGRRAGDSQAYEEAVKLTQMMDVLHIQSVAPEPQDCDVATRHIFMTQTQLSMSDKIISLYARGRGQVMQNFALIQEALALDDERFQAHPHSLTIINSNSPRIFDKPMAQGIIDFAAYGQCVVITPFCLAGAMAPISIEGALLLQHMECLAGITLSQLVKKGAPVAYGGFGSNVDMRSGSPAFGTPEHLKMQIGSGQLARHIGLPWRSAAGSAANLADAQGNLENTNALWGALQANANLVLHAAGWLEGGLTFGFEKFISDCEALQIIAELCRPHQSDDLAEALAAVAGTEPGGHFFDNPHTMTRYQDAFYTPLLADLRNYGAWQEAGGQSAEARATAIWQDMLTRFHPSDAAQERAERIAPLADSLRAKGGAAPLDG